LADDPLTYRAAGVDIEAGYRAVERIKELARATHGPEVLGGIGRFGGLYALGEGPDDPVLVAGTDGVGTKLKIAFAMDRHDTIGIDLVAYCVNDIICHGARPLFFLDYVAAGKINPDQVAEIVAGIARGCREAGCALIGGETAEMPGFYQRGEYDVAGFAVGMTTRARLIDGSRVEPGDVIVGIASTGLQASGFSLVREAVLNRAGWELHEPVPELGNRPVGEVLLTPTAIYARTILSLMDAVDVRGVANISGGGLPENLPRALPPGTQAVVERGRWTVPPVFRFVQKCGTIPEEEMWNTFNMGIGMAVVVPAGQADQAVAHVRSTGHDAWPIGYVAEGPAGVRWEG